MIHCAVAVRSVSGMKEFNHHHHHHHSFRHRRRHQLTYYFNMSRISIAA
jgi:hypothetical protein